MIRKTYVSIQANIGISLTIITSQMGAESSITFTLNVKDRNTRKGTSEMVEKALRKHMLSIDSMIPCNTFPQKRSPENR